MSGLTISNLIGSSQYKAIADDTLKDEDNAAWVMALEPMMQQEWVERIGWIRLVDRLAENELVDASSTEFRRFYAAWRGVMDSRNLPASCEHREILASLHDHWLKQPMPPGKQLSLQAWNQFLAASACYHQSNLVIPTLEAYSTMAQALSGSCFQLLPFLHPRHWRLACSFGALDQFFNNLRDLREDAEQGVCYIPTEVLKAFAVDRQEILQLQAGQTSNFQRLMEFWLDTYLPLLKQKTAALMTATDLHPSWVIWRDWSVHRYHRIERVFRECNFDYTLFPQSYWAEVKQDLPQRLNRLKQQEVDRVRSAPGSSCLRAGSLFLTVRFPDWGCQPGQGNRELARLVMSSPA